MDDFHCAALLPCIQECEMSWNIWACYKRLE